MAGTSGATPPAVTGTRRLFPKTGKDALNALFAAPEQFSFEQAVRILFHAYGDGRSVLRFIREDLRIRPHLSLGFPPTDIVALERLAPQGHGPRFRLTVSMLGLYGASSPLPTFYTEDLLAEDMEGRSGTRDFLDTLNEGFFSLFLCAGWFRHRLLHTVTEQHNDAVCEQFYSLAGLGDPIMRRPFSSVQGLFRLIGPLSQYPRSAAGLEAFLAACLDVPVRVEQCILRHALVPEEQRCCLGREHRLGESAIIGSTVEDLSGKIAVILGPMKREKLLRYTPSSPGYEQVTQLTNFYCTEALELDLYLVLDTENNEPELDSDHGSDHGPDHGEKRGLALGQSAYGCLNGDAWLALAPGLEGQAFFPNRPHPELYKEQTYARQSNEHLRQPREEGEKL